MRDALQFEADTDGTGRGDVAEVGEQSIGNIDAGAGNAGQRLPECELRLGPIEPRDAMRMARVRAPALLDGG
jgi:hypothetical protein